MDKINYEQFIQIAKEKGWRVETNQGRDGKVPRILRLGYTTPKGFNKEVVLNKDPNENFFDKYIGYYEEMDWVEETIFHLKNFQLYKKGKATSVLTDWYGKGSIVDIVDKDLTAYKEHVTNFYNTIKKQQ